MRFCSEENVAGWIQAQTDVFASRVPVDGRNAQYSAVHRAACRQGTMIASLPIQVDLVSVGPEDLATHLHLAAVWNSQIILGN